MTHIQSVPLRVLIAVSGAIIAGVICYQLILVAGHKPFWQDEGRGDLVDCAHPYSFLLTQGALPECSPTPLYYVFQKFVVSHVRTSEKIIYSYRAISIASAILAIVILFSGFTKFVGWAWGFLAVLVMITPGKFYQFGAEDRPYMLWVFLFTATLMYVAFLASKSWGEISVGSKTFLALLLMGVTLVAGGGMVQAFGFLISLSLWQASLNPWRWVTHPAFKFQLPIAIVSLGLGVYYALHGCVHYDGGTYDLLKTRDWTLVRGVLGLLWPTTGGSCRDYVDPCGLGTALINVFVLAGVAVPLWLWKKRKDISKDKQFLLAASVISIVQIGCAVILGIMVAAVHYYFIQRIFLYLMTLRAVLAACGGYLCLNYVIEKWNRTFPGLIRERLFHAVVLAGVLLEFSTMLYLHQRAFSIAAREGSGLALVGTECPPARSALALVDTPAPSEESGLNFIVVFGEHLKQCGWKSAEEPKVYVLPEYDLGARIYGFRITDKLPARSRVLSFFDRPLLSTP